MRIFPFSPTPVRMPIIFFCATSFLSVYSEIEYFLEASFTVSMGGIIMLNFNQQLLNCFFYEKKVEYNCIFLKKHYYSIFPSPSLFVNFLSSTNREEQTIYAKQIIKRMCFCKYNSILFDLYKNLIDLEETKLTDDSKSHVPRDHSIHSVNTYLLGIYLYFSFNILQLFQLETK